MGLFIRTVFIFTLCVISFITNAAELSVAQVERFHDKLLQASEKKDIKVIRNSIADSAQIILSVHKNGKVKKAVTWTKRRYLHELNNKWNMLQSSSSKVLQRKVSLSENKYTAYIKFKTRVKEIIAASVVKGSTDEIIDVKLVNGQPMATKVVGNFYYD